MSFIDLARSRFSVREFSPQKVEKDKLEYVLRVANLAPSAVNFQPWHFVVVTQPEIMQELHNCYHRDWFKTASICIVVFGNHQQSWKRRDGKDHCDIDLAIAIDHLTLAATEQGLGTCWVCNFDVEKCRQLFKFAAHFEPIALLPIGYPLCQQNLKEKTRKNLEEIVTWK